MTDEIFHEMRKLSRQQFQGIWEIAKTGELDVLSEADRRVAEIMLEHQEECFNQFEMADLTYDYEFDPDPDSIIDAVERGLEKKTEILLPNTEAKILSWLRRLTPRLLWKFIHHSNKEM